MIVTYDFSRHTEYADPESLELCYTLFCGLGLDWQGDAIVTVAIRYSKDVSVPSFGLLRDTRDYVVYYYTIIEVMELEVLKGALLVGRWLFQGKASSACLYI